MVSQHALQVSGGCIPACLAGFQAHTQGGSSGVWPGGSPGPHPEGCIPACTEADPPTATAVGGTHPTGIHSCFGIHLVSACARVFGI